MLKIGNLWLNIEKVNMAHLDESGRLSIYFNQNAWLKVNGNEQPDEIKQLVACLDAAAGCAPAAKVEAEKKMTFSGVDCEGRSWLGCSPVDRPSKAKTGLERIREMGIDELIELVEANLGYICPPPLRGSKSCHREITCETCWREWLASSADGDPHA